MALSAFRPLRTTRLPIFRMASAGSVLFYAPGYVVVVRADRAAEFEAAIGDDAPDGAPSPRRRRNLAIHGPMAMGGRSSPRSRPRQWSWRPGICARASHARDASGAARDRAFKPVCLTIYLHNACNLKCSYCFSEATPRQAARLDLTAIRAGAERVGANCREADLPFTAVFHGGGEPMLDGTLTEAALGTVEAVAARHGRPMFRYIATNGVMPARSAAWMARRFDLVGVSCDGPPDVQNAQRPTWGSQGSAAQVERTAAIVRAAGTPLHVRVTVTPDSVQRQPEIADYICRVLCPQEIHVELVYRAGRAADSGAFRTLDVDAYVAGYQAAQAIAARFGIAWLGAGARPWTIHGPFCNVLRDVLQIVPGGAATACFRSTSAEAAQRDGTWIGGLTADGADWAIDEARIGVLRGVLTALPPSCRDCFNQHHCARACPDHCPIEPDDPSTDARCRVQAALAEAHIRSTASRLTEQAVSGQWLWAGTV